MMPRQNNTNVNKNDTKQPQSIEVTGSHESSSSSNRNASEEVKNSSTPSSDRDRQEQSSHSGVMSGLNNCCDFPHDSNDIRVYTPSGPYINSKYLSPSLLKQLKERVAQQEQLKVVAATPQINDTSDISKQHW
jgi:hypothetical protein